MSNFSLYNKIKILNNYENLDADYGPYNSKAEANTDIPQNQRKAGKTIGVLDSNGIIKEYWWKKDNATDAELTEKGTEVDLTNYYTKSEVDSLIADFQTSADVSTQIQNEISNIEPTLQGEIQATVAAGAIEVGDTINEGISFTDFVKQLMYDVYEPTFNTPYVSTNSYLGDKEERSSISNLSIDVDFNRGSADGNIVGGIWNFNQKQKDGSNNIKRIASLPTNHTLSYTDFNNNIIEEDSNSNNEDHSFIIGSYKVKSGNNNFSVGVEGVTTSSDTFNKSDGSIISKPSVSGTYTVSKNLMVGKRRIFTGSPNTLPTTSTERRNMGNPGPSPFEGTSTINATVVTTNFVLLLPPGVNLLSVETESAEFIEESFIETSGNVSVAAPGTASDFTDYREFIFTSDNPPNNGMDITIKLN